MHTGPQQPVQYHQFLPSPYQQVRPMHAGLMLPSAEFTPPFAQFQQTKQNYSRPQLPENQHLFLRQQEPIFMDEDLPGPPVVPGGPIPTTDVAEQQNHDSETLIYDPIAEAEKIAYEDVGMEKAQYTTLDPRITASEISTVNDQILDFQQQYQNTPMAEEATNFCNSAQGFNQIAMVFHQNGNMQEADTFVSLSSRIIDLGNITLQSGAKGVWGSAKYIAKRALEAPGKVWNDPWGVLTKKSKDLGLAVAGGLAIAILPTPIGGGIVAASFGYEIFQNFANKSYEEAVESTAQLLTTDFIVNVASKKGLHHLIPQLLNCGKKVYHGIKNNKILKKAVYDGGKIASNLVNKFGPKVAQKTLSALKNNPSLIEKEKDVLTAANKVAGEMSSKITWVYYKKHIPQSNMSWRDIIKSTSNGGPARYNPNIGLDKTSAIERLERFVWEKGINVAMDKPNKIWKVIRLDYICGACNGNETPYMRVEFSSGFIHGHPITEAEYMKLLKR